MVSGSGYETTVLKTVVHCEFNLFRNVQKCMIELYTVICCYCDIVKNVHFPSLSVGSNVNTSLFYYFYYLNACTSALTGNINRIRYVFLCAEVLQIS